MKGGPRMRHVAIARSEFRIRPFAALAALCVRAVGGPSPESKCRPDEWAGSGEWGGGQLTGQMGAAVGGTTSRVILWFKKKSLRSLSYIIKMERYR